MIAATRPVGCDAKGDEECMCSALLTRSRSTGNNRTHKKLSLYELAFLVHWSGLSVSLRLGVDRVVNYVVLKAMRFPATLGLTVASRA